MERMRFLRAFILLVPAVLAAQTVRVPKAQALVDALLKKHPEVQTIGLHTVPPGMADNLNIACSKLGKVGKISADIDMQVIATGKPSIRRAKLGAFDIGVPIADASGHPFGMIVLVLPQRYAEDENEALRKVLALRDELQQQIPESAILFQGATLVNAPVVMVAQTPLPGVKGALGPVEIDDVAKQIVVHAPENGTVEVFDLAGEHLSSRPQHSSHAPSPMAVDQSEGRRFVARQGKVVIEDVATGKVVSTLDGVTDPGSVLFDAQHRRIFITGDSGIAIYQQRDTGYSLIARFGTMHGKFAAYEPSLKRLYIVHGSNDEDGAGLQVYEVRD